MTSFSQTDEQCRFFMHDELADGRRLRIFNVIDDVTKQCLAVFGGQARRGNSPLSLRAAASRS